MLNVRKEEYDSGLQDPRCHHYGNYNQGQKFKSFPFLMHYLKVGNFQVNWSIKLSPVLSMDSAIIMIIILRRCLIQLARAK